MASSRLMQKISRAVEKNFSDQTSFASQLVRENSENPFTPDQASPKHAIEKGVGELVYERLRSLGFVPKRVGSSEKRTNIVCYWGPRQFRKSLILNGNMDTAPAGLGYPLVPPSGELRGG